MREETNVDNCSKYAVCSDGSIFTVEKGPRSKRDATAKKDDRVLYEG